MWAVMPFDEVNAALDVCRCCRSRLTFSTSERRLASRSPPCQRVSVPWHRGAVRICSASPIELSLSNRLGCVKDGRLDRHHRWGGRVPVSADAARQIGGQWTARCRRTLNSLQQRASERGEIVASFMPIEFVGNGRVDLHPAFRGIQIRRRPPRLWDARYGPLCAGRPMPVVRLLRGVIGCHPPALIPGDTG